jgi:hypothetical protein
VVGSLAVQIAFGPSGKQADTTGALQEIASHPGGDCCVVAAGGGLCRAGVVAAHRGRLRQAGTGGRTPGKRPLSLAFGLFCGVVRATVVSFILGTGGRKPSGNTQPTMFTATGATLNHMNPAARREALDRSGDGLITKVQLTADRCGPACTGKTRALSPSH